MKPNVPGVIVICVVAFFVSVSIRGWPWANISGGWTIAEGAWALIGGVVGAGLTFALDIWRRRRDADEARIEKIRHEAEGLNTLKVLVERGGGDVRNHCHDWVRHLQDSEKNKLPLLRGMDDHLKRLDHLVTWALQLPQMHGLAVQIMDLRRYVAAAMETEKWLSQFDQNDKSIDAVRQRADRVRILQEDIYKTVAEIQRASQTERCSCSI